MSDRLGVSPQPDTALGYPKGHPRRVREIHPEHLHQNVELAVGSLLFAQPAFFRHRKKGVARNALESVFVSPRFWIKLAATSA